MPLEPSDGISRRDFVKAAVAIGGSSALSACLAREQSGRETTPTAEDAEFPRGSDPSTKPRRQHEWNDYLVRNAHGNTVLPEHQLLLCLEYEGSTPPTDAEREQVRAAMGTIDRAVQWGTGGREGASINDGLLTMLGYSPRYFERFGGGDVEGLTPPDEVLSAVGEDPAKADDHDALLILSSDFGSLLLAAEEALVGERETINGVEMDATFDGVLSVAERRSGVAGKGVVAEKLGRDDVPEDAPLSMGYRSGFADNQASEGRVTVEGGPLAGGTVLANSRLHIDLDRWYDQRTEERAAEMFCPAHDTEEVGDTAEALGNSSRIAPEDVDGIDEHAEEYDRVGHAQKVARARDDGFAPRMLRRTEGVATDVPEGTDFNFVSVQNHMDAFVEARKAMNRSEYDHDVEAEDHGIVDYLETRARATYFVPPRDRRALPVV